MVEDMARYYVKHNVWCLFQGECDENDRLCSYPELNGISIKDNSYIISSIDDLIHIGKFIAVAAAIRYDRGNVLKTCDDLPDTSIKYAHPLSKECHKRLGQALQTMPTPHPSQCYDAPELLGRAQAYITFGILLPDYGRVSMASLSNTSDITLFNKVRDHIFGKIVLQCTRRMQRFYEINWAQHYHRLFSIKKCETCFCPRDAH